MTEMPVTREVLHPPIRPDVMTELAALWEDTFGPGNAEFRALVEASELEHNRTLVYVARDNGQLAGTTQLVLSRSEPFLGGVGEVVTPIAFRRRGIARDLVTRARDEFLEAGGLACFLGTVNPAARALYEELGWRQFAGSTVMCLDPASRSPQEFLDEFFEPEGENRTVAVVPGGPEHRLQVIPLILAQHAAPVLDLNVNLFSTRIVVQNSCMGLYPRYAQLVEKRGGVWFAALDIRGRVVGAGSLCPIDDRTARIDAFAHEEFPDARLSLLTSLWFDARELGFAECITEVATVDAEKQNDLEQLGFRVDQESTMTVPDGDSLPALRMTCPPSWGSA